MSIEYNVFMKQIITLLLIIIIGTSVTSIASAQRVCFGDICDYECQIADVSVNQTTGQNNDITYCITASSPQALLQIAQATATCREAGLSDNNIIGLVTERQNCSCYYENKMSLDSRPDLVSVCSAANAVAKKNPLAGPAPAVSTTKQYTSDDLTILEDTDPNSPNFGRYYTCLTLPNIDRNVGVVETSFRNSTGQLLCRPENADVRVGNYNWFEYFDNVTETRFGFSIGTDPTERSPRSLFCSTASGKGADADDPLAFIKGIENPAINTALGCIATDPVGFTRDYLTISIGIGGALALLLLLYAFFIMATSQGDPTKVQGGKQIISSVVQGLLVIILSVVLLNFLGINVLGLPGLI